MRFALLGHHPDGLALAQHLVASGQHQLVRVFGVPDEHLACLGNPRVDPDAEETLADPEVEAVLVAGLRERSQQLLRAVQSDHHVLCLNPCGGSPVVAQEASLAQGDTRKTLVPVHPVWLHPGISAFARRFQQWEPSRESPGQQWPALRVEIDCPEDGTGCRSGLLRSYWHALQMLRKVGGDLAEIWGYGEAEEWEGPILLAGTFLGGGLFTVMLGWGTSGQSWRLIFQSEQNSGELVLPHGLEGPGRLTWKGGADKGDEDWPAWDPWQSVRKEWEGFLQGEPGLLSWSDEIRILEADEGVRHSLRQGRVQKLERQEVNEEVGFKSTMALAGCGLFWLCLVLLIASQWLPWLGWLILPMLVLFVALQALGWAIPGTTQGNGEDQAIRR